MDRKSECHCGLLTFLVLFLFLGSPWIVESGVANAATVFGTEPGGRTIGGPGQSLLTGGNSQEIFTFLGRGPTPVRFVCVTGANVGIGKASLHFSSRIGETMTASFSAGESRIVCAEMTAIKVQCHGQGTECTFLWRVDDLK